jgi:2',3'-cyclic-nucleotide 2'-phosphodiesterase (5'-nucleotidase family)
MHRGLGGLSRRATVLTQLCAADNPPSIRLDAGNFLWGDDSIASGGAVMVAAYDALRYDVVNVAWQDLRFGRDKTVAALAGAQFKAVSANLLDEKSGEPIFKPMAVVAAGGARIAVLGVTEPPAALRSLPSVRESLAGVRVTPIHEALERWLPEAQKTATHVVLMYHGSPQGLVPVLAAFPDAFAAVFVGGIRPQYVPASAKELTVATSEHGKHVATVLLSERPLRPELVAVEPTIPEDEGMGKVLAGFRSQQQAAAIAAPPASASAAPHRP